MTNIDIINASTVLADADVSAAVAALQVQVSRDFAPEWGIQAKLHFVGSGQVPTRSHWWLTITNDSDEAGALGYHDLTPNGGPIGKAFARTCQQDGVSWTVDLSHELLEMLADPDINLCCLDASGSRLYAYEVGDPVQDDACGYLIDGVLVSDFVLPAYFEISRKQNKLFSFMDHVSIQFGLAPGGYISYMDISSPKGWQQITRREAKGLAMPLRPRVGSRRERRRTPREDWVISSAHAG